MRLLELLPGKIYKVYKRLEEPAEMKVATIVTSEIKHASRSLHGCLLTLPFDQDVRLKSSFHSYKYFHFLEPEIRSIFTFRESLLEKAQDVKMAVAMKYNRKPEDILFIGVHIRRGDKVERGGVPGASYFNTSMDLYKRWFPGSLIHFVVASDTPSWCNESFKGHRDVTVVDGNTPWQDLAILSQCNHSIISTGTFSWWAGYLAGGHVVYYKDYLQPMLIDFFRRQHRIFNVEDYYPPTWIGIYNHSFEKNNKI